MTAVLDLDLHTKCNDYLGSRRSNYAFRCKRYSAVYNKLLELGLQPDDMIVDLGAGNGKRKDFHTYARSQGWNGLYLPIDGSIDGTDLDAWHWPTYQTKTDFFVCIEVLEHLHIPTRLMATMEQYCNKGAVATTPNSTAVDTLAMDPTHITPLYGLSFRNRGWKVKVTSLFNTPWDSLLASYSK